MWFNVLSFRRTKFGREVSLLKLLMCHVGEIIQTHFVSPVLIGIVSFYDIVVCAENIEPILDCVFRCIGSAVFCNVLNKSRMLLR